MQVSPLTITPRDLLGEYVLSFPATLASMGIGVLKHWKWVGGGNGG